MAVPRKPRLRAVEAIVVPDARYGKVLVLRDTQGIAKGHVAIPPAAVPIVARFDGEHTVADLARELGEPASVIERLAIDLDRALMLTGATFDAAVAAARAEFEALPLRPASHAGGAYPSDPKALAEYMNRQCIARAPIGPAGDAANANGPIVGLVAPHIDPWRGAVGYGHAYGALARALAAAPAVDTFLVFGTSHAPMKEPFALLRKGYATPLGPMPVDEDAVDTLVRAARFDPFADALNHKREHSIEFQAAFLRHVLGARRATIIPILAGLGKAQESGSAPRNEPRVAHFFDAIGELVAKRSGRIVVVAGADLAHVGPRFGDARAKDAPERSVLEARDRESLRRFGSRESASFWDHVSEDMDERRVCGLGPMMSLLEVLGGAKSTPELLHYEQTIDDDDGSIVSHAALALRSSTG
ncbi:AmmeMemoRadiSam system protein B [soil metagenome]